MKTTRDLLEEVVAKYNVTRDEALESIDVVLDNELDERHDINFEVIEKDLYNDILAGFEKFYGKKRW